MLFLVGSSAIVRLSWRSLGDPRSHGFHRFFPVEFLLAPILLDSPVWFRDALSVRQILSYCLAALSLGLAFQGFRLLLLTGRPSSTQPVETNLVFTCLNKS